MASASPGASADAACAGTSGHRLRLARGPMLSWTRHYLASARGREDYGSSDARLLLRPRGVQVEARHDLAQHHLNLELSEARPQAAAHAAAERDPGVGARRLLEEALGPEGARLVVHIAAAVHQ